MIWWASTPLRQAQGRLLSLTVNREIDLLKHQNLKFRQTLSTFVVLKNYIFPDGTFFEFNQ